MAIGQHPLEMGCHPPPCYIITQRCWRWGSAKAAGREPDAVSSYLLENPESKWTEYISHSEDRPSPGDDGLRVHPSSIWCSSRSSPSLGHDEWYTHPHAGPWMPLQPSIGQVPTSNELMAQETQLLQSSGSSHVLTYVTVLVADSPHTSGCSVMSYENWRWPSGEGATGAAGSLRRQRRQTLREERSTVDRAEGEDKDASRSCGHSQWCAGSTPSSL